MPNENRVSLKDFLNCFDSDKCIQMELYNASNDPKDMIFYGPISTFVNNTDLFNQYSTYYVEPDFVEIDATGRIEIIIDE